MVRDVITTMKTRIIIGNPGTAPGICVV